MLYTKLQVQSKMKHCCDNVGCQKRPKDDIGTISNFGLKLHVFVKHGDQKVVLHWSHCEICSDLCKMWKPLFWSFLWFSQKKKKVVWDKNGNK